MYRNGKITTIDERAPILAAARRKGKVVHGHGVFDLFSIRHIRHLEEACRLGEVPVDTVTSDWNVTKGPDRSSHHAFVVKGERPDMLPAER